MRRVLFALLVAAGFVSVVVGAAIAFVTPRLSYGLHVIQSYGIVVPPSEEIEVDEGLTTTYVDERGYLPIVAGAVLFSAAFLGRRRKKTSSLLD